MCTIETQRYARANRKCSSGAEIWMFIANTNRIGSQSIGSWKFNGIRNYFYGSWPTLLHACCVSGRRPCSTPSSRSSNTWTTEFVSHTLVHVRSHANCECVCRCSCTYVGIAYASVCVCVCAYAAEQRTEIYRNFILCILYTSSFCAVELCMESV